jgi:hypothetical protein
VIGFPKPEKRVTTKGRKRRQERAVIAVVRAVCVERDGYCRLSALHAECGGPSEWAHLGDKKRARTRGMTPELRHTTAGSLMLCRTHHRLYDSGILDIDALTDRGADGRIEITRFASPRLAS